MGQCSSVCPNQCSPEWLCAQSVRQGPLLGNLNLYGESHCPTWLPTDFYPTCLSPTCLSSVPPTYLPPALSRIVSQPPDFGLGQLGDLGAPGSISFKIVPLSKIGGESVEPWTCWESTGLGVRHGECLPLKPLKMWFPKLPLLISIFYLSDIAEAKTLPPSKISWLPDNFCVLIVRPRWRLFTMLLTILVWGKASLPMHNRISCQGIIRRQRYWMLATLYFHAGRPIRPMSDWNRFKDWGSKQGPRTLGISDIITFVILVINFIIDIFNHVSLVSPAIIIIQIPHCQIRCDNSCPLQSYTPNDVIVSKFEQLAQKFPQTAKLVEVGQKT